MLKNIPAEVAAASSVTGATWLGAFLDVFSGAVAIAVGLLSLVVLGYSLAIKRRQYRAGKPEGK